MYIHIYKNFNSLLCVRNSRFTKGRQEDSHEALRCIFDALKEEEIQVCYT